MKKRFLFAGIFLALFVLWTLFISLVDVKPIGPQGSFVGFATINSYFHSLTGVNMTLYTVTDWLGLVPLAFCFSFAFLGLLQAIKRKSILKVDCSLFILGSFYIVTLLAYILFENLVINYRPVLINGVLEASYPSSTTLLTLCIMPTTIMQLNSRIKNKTLNKITVILLALFTFFMVIARTISGVHWLTDIIGGILLSSGLVTFYYSINK